MDKPIFIVPFSGFLMQIFLCTLWDMLVNSVCGGPLYRLLLDKCLEYPALLTEVTSVSNFENQWHAWVHSIVSTSKARFNHDLPEEQSTISF